MNGRHRSRSDAWGRRLLLVVAAVLAVALPGAVRAGAASAPSWVPPLNPFGNQALQVPDALAVVDLDGNGVEDYVVADSAANQRRKT